MPPPRTRRRRRASSHRSKTLLLLRGLMATAGPLLLLLAALGGVGLALPGARAQPDTAGYRSGWTLSQYPNPSVVRSFT